MIDYKIGFEIFSCMENLFQVNNAAAPGIVIAKPDELRSFKDGAAFVSKLTIPTSSLALI